MSVPAGAGIAGNQSQSLAALELLANPERLQAKIDQLKAAEDSAREQIALAGPASEILSIRAEIDSLKAQAEETLQDAREQAFSIVTDAEQQAQSIVDVAQQDAARTVEDANNVAKAADDQRALATTKVAEAKRELSALQAREDELAEKEAALQQKAADLADQETSLQGERAKLANARAAIEAAL